ncbi:MAG: T9SS type A sorting domain-containing protein [Bacteroidetes bacterium]|nr:T9SS type A sorting domain-containing protein [Bacteroidota bacterium]
MRNTFFTLLSFISISALAQPSITSAWVPTSGIQYLSSQFSAQSLSEGSSGAGVTWDLSTIDTAGTSPYAYIPVSSGPQNSLYPSASACLNAYNGEDYEYYKLTGNRYEIVGAVQPGSGYNVYTNNATIIQFPCTYQSTFSDTSRYVDYLLNPADTLISDNTMTATADGYGTLITKGQTFSNVLRVHLLTHEIDSDITFSSIYHGTYDAYIWISSSYPGIVLANVSHMNYDGNLQDQGYYAIVQPLGVSDIRTEGIRSWTIAPQPASGTARISVFNDSQEKEATIIITDLTGRELSRTNDIITQGTSSLGLDVSALAEGIYTVSLQINGAISTQKLVVR